MDRVVDYLTDLWLVPPRTIHLQPCGSGRVLLFWIVLGSGTSVSWQTVAHFVCMTQSRDPRIATKARDRERH